MVARVCATQEIGYGVYAERGLGVLEGGVQSSERREVKPIEVGRYRLRNGRTAKVVEITIANDVRAASGYVEGLARYTDESMEWDGEDGLFGNDPGPWDLAERLLDAPNESVLTILRREHVAMMTIADSHAAISRQALASAQEIEHRIQEMERMEG